MKIIAGLIIKKWVLVLVMVCLVTSVVACGKRSPDTTTGTTYKLTHSAADAEYILSWDEIVSRCPDIGAYDKQEAFVRRGESKQSGTGGTSTLEMDSPAAWGSTRFVFDQKSPAGDSFRGFGVWIMYFETAEYLDEHMSSAQMSGLPFQEEEDFVTVVLESGPPTKSVQLHIAGNQFYILLMVTASSDESLFFSKEKLMELLPTIKSNVSSLEITPLPSEIPDRKLADDSPSEWQEFMTFRSDELPSPVRVHEAQHYPDAQHYNDSFFSSRPLVQSFNFIIDKDWQFVITATGEIGTRFEVVITITSSGEYEKSYSSFYTFSLHSETVTVTREERLVEGYEPPVSIEIKIFFDQPMSWVMTIEK